MRIQEISMADTVFVMSDNQRLKAVCVTMHGQLIGVTLITHITHVRNMRNVSKKK